MSEVSKPKFKENIDIECFGENGFLKWAEINKKDIQIKRKDISKEEWNAIKRHIKKQKNNPYNIEAYNL